MPEKSEKRKMSRLLNAYEVFARDGQKTFGGKSRDVNPFGVGFYSDREVKVGTKIDLSIYIMEANLSYEVKGIVRHCTALSGELSLIHISEPTRPY